MNQEEYKIRMAGINGKIKQAESWIEFYKEKIEVQEKNINTLNKVKYNLERRKQSER